MRFPRSLASAVSLALLALWSATLPVQAQPAASSKVNVITPATTWVRAFTAVSTNTTGFSAISAKSALTTNLTTGPVTSSTTGTLVIDRPAGNIICVAFFGDDDNETLNIRVWAWDRLTVTSGSTVTYQWIPYCLWDGGCTFSAAAGLATGLIDNTMFFADTITATSDRGLSPLSTRVMAASAADDGMAMLVIDPLTATRIEIEMERNSCDAFNAIWKIGG